MLVTSLSLTAEFIGSNTSSSAFIYGLMSLTDKVSNGLAVVLIQHFIPYVRLWGCKHNWNFVCNITISCGCRRV